MFININANATVSNLVPAALHTGNGDVSNRYVHIQTSDLLDDLSAHGFRVVNQKQSKGETSKHGIVLVNRELGFLDSTGSDNFASVTLFNSHDGTSATKLIAGFYRLICSNGMVSGRVSDSVSVRHSTKGLAKLSESIAMMPEKLRVYAEMIKMMQNRQLTETEKLSLVQNIHDLIKSQRAIRADDLLQIRRSEDNASDAYTVANVIQENIIRGGSLSAMSNRRLRSVSTIQNQTMFTQLVLNETAKLIAA